MLTSSLTTQFIRFNLVGIVNTSVGVVVIIGVITFTSLGPFVANAMGYGAGLTCSFLLNRRWTFADQSYSYPLGRFVIAFAVSYGINCIVLYSMIIVASEHPVLSQITAMISYTIAFFVLSRYFVFREDA